MVHQTPVENPQWAPPQQDGNGRSAAVGVRNGVGDLLHDVVSLAELQTQLVAVDARESMQKAQTPLIMFGIGAVLGLGSIPVLLMAIGQAFVYFFHWHEALGYLVSGLLGAIVAGVLMWLAYRTIDDVIGVFKRSQAELVENIRWIKYALTRGRRPPR
jgi:hypothetical protein